MIRSNLAEHDCALVRAMGEIGDGWMLLTLWSALEGNTRFEAMQENLGVARNILSDRLRRLVDLGLLQRKRLSPDSKRFEYVPTAAARDLHAPLRLLRDWGEKNCPGPRQAAA